MSEKRKRQSQLNSAANVLQGVLQGGKSPLAEQFIRWRLWNAWGDVVGPEMAQYTMPVGYLNGMLYIWVKNAARMQELTFLVRPIRQKINDHIGRNYVKSIRFTMDKKAVPIPQETEEPLRDYLTQPTTTIED